MVILLLVASPAQQTPTITVVAVNPSERLTLGAQDQVSIHVAYQSPQPVLIWMRPHFGGQEVKAGSSHPSPGYPAGSGDAFGWFQVNRPEAIDAIHIRVAAPRTHQILAEFDHPVDFSFSGQPGITRPRPQWALQMSAAQQEQIRAQAAAARSNAPSCPGDAFIGFGFMVVVLVAFAATLAWPAWAIYRWRGHWRLAAAAPLVLMGIVISRIIIETQRDPTSHNLWPFEIVMFGFGCLVAMASLTAARRFFTRS